jgi:reactive intermediate/imine deaminase
MKKALGGRGPGALPFSPAYRAGDYVLVSGQVAFDAEGRLVAGGIEAETRQVMQNISAALELAGCSLADVVKTTVWLSDRADFKRFNEVYGSFFPQDPPARSTVEARLMIDAAVEIEAMAYKPV